MTVIGLINSSGQKSKSHIVDEIEIRMYLE